VSIETSRRYVFQYGVILANAPRASGVYALFKEDELLYVGEAESIYIGLLNHLDRQDSLEFQMPTTFAFEVCPLEARKVRMMELVFKLRPPYTERPELKVRED
jgi:hypothetical protein